MTTSAFCMSKGMSRCHRPLIPICGNTTQIKLDLQSCNPCAGKAAGLLLTRAGCPEWETVCEPPRTDCCGVVDNRPTFWGNKRTVMKPQPSVLYPLHEIDPQGYSVFALDGKLAELGAGRYRAEVMAHDGNDYYATGVVFDVELSLNPITLVGVETVNKQPESGACVV